MPMKTTDQIALAAGLLALGATLAASVRAKLSAEQLAEMAQNPIGNMISLPFQDNINFNVGPEDGTLFRFDFTQPNEESR
ncbi:MAG: hypothetical protein U1F70_07635 [Candidatus Competibacteraceae bacterium]